MLSYCSSLKSLPDFSKWKTNNITDMSYLFCECSSLRSLPDISKWKTNKVTDMSYMFYKCSSLKFIPNISKWNADKVNNINKTFYGCDSLILYPDISKWNIKNSDINKIFNDMSFSSSLPFNSRKTKKHSSSITSKENSEESLSNNYDYNILNINGICFDYDNEKDVYYENFYN